MAYALEPVFPEPQIQAVVAVRELQAALAGQALLSCLFQLPNTLAQPQAHPQLLRQAQIQY
jgi:hypothetical protein